MLLLSPPCSQSQLIHLGGWGGWDWQALRQLRQGTRWWVLDNIMTFITRSSCTGDRYLSQFRENIKLCAKETPMRKQDRTCGEQDMWGCWLVGWLFDWFIFKQAGQAGGRSQWLSVAVTLVIFPSSVSWVCSKKQCRFEGVERNMSALTEPLRLMLSRLIWERT